jgi:predicted MFS family arabinose efflux permease
MLTTRPAARSFGADAQQYGLMQSLFSLAQLVGGLLCGPLMDVYGARWGMSLAFVSGAVSYGLTAASTSMPMLYLSRLPTAFQHAALAARVAISARTRGPAQAALLGYIGLAYTVGAIVGPVLGGALASRSLRCVSLVAAGLSLLSAASVLLLLPSSRAPQAAGAPPRGPRPSLGSKLALGEFARVCALPGVRPLLAVKGVFSLVLALFHGVFALAASTHFGLSPAVTGAPLSAMSVVTMLTQAFLIDWAVSRFDTAAVYRYNVGIMALSFAGMAFARGIVGIAVWVVPMTAASSILFTANTAQLNRAASRGDRGTINAVDMSVSSAVRVFSPALGTTLLQNLGFWSIGAVGCVLLLALLVMVELNGARVAPPGLSLRDLN